MNHSMHQNDQHSVMGTFSSGDRSEIEKEQLKNGDNRVSTIIRLIYVFLFAYTGISKLINSDSFIGEIRKIPFFGSYAWIIGWGIPVLELIMALGIFLPVKKIQRFSMKPSVLLMGIFTLYLLLMITLVKEKMCHCGGVIGSMGWTQHLAFNFIILLLGLFSIRRNN